MKITKSKLRSLIKEEVEAVLSEVEDMSRKGNAGEDFAIPSAAWDRAFRKNGIKISYHGRMGVERDEWRVRKNQDISTFDYIKSIGYTWDMVPSSQVAEG